MQVTKMFYESADGRIHESTHPPARYVMLAANWRVAIIWGPGRNNRSYNLSPSNLWRLQRTLARHGRIVRQDEIGSTWIVGAK